MTDRPGELLALALSAPNEAARLERSGAIFVPSADPRLVVCDPLAVDAARPLARPVRAASHWWVSRLEMPVQGGWRVGAVLAALDVEGAGLPKSWERALLDGGEDRFDIDHGTAALTDAAALRHLRRDRALREQVQAHVEGPAGCEFFDAGEGACDLAWFPSGMGEGSYGAWWGLNADGEPIWLLIDFEIDA